MNISKVAIVAWSILCFSLFPALAADTNAPPAPSEVVKLAEQTVKRLAFGAASWVVNCHLSSEAAFRVEGIRDHDRQLLSIYQVSSGKSSKICKIVESGGIWYVMENGYSTKARPYEAELHFPAAYLILSLAELRCVVDEDLLKADIFESRKDGKLFYRLPVAAHDRRLLESILSASESPASEAEALKKPGVAEQLKQIRELLARGTPLTIDEKTGIIVETKVQQVHIEVEDFHWLDAAPEGAFDLPHDFVWKDLTKPWPEADYADCILVARDPLYALDSDIKLNPDAYVLNLRTGEMRRLPFSGVVSMGDCFLKDRREVIASGVDAFAGTHLIKVNLATGRATKMELEGEVGGFDTNGELSPDGKQFATLHWLGGNSVDFQMRLADLKTGKLRDLGTPGQIGGPFSWLPDGKGLILKRFIHPENVNTAEPRMVCRLDLDGHLTDLRAGDTPLVLRKSRKILYEDTDTRLWHTCDLDGSSPQLFGDGFAGCGMPAVSPDETQIIFARFEKGKLPQLMLFDIGKSKGKKIGPADGYTAMPVWR